MMILIIDPLLFTSSCYYFINIKNIAKALGKFHTVAVTGYVFGSSFLDDSKAEGEEVEYGYPITCGDSRAVLLFKKFVCPGINVRCVKVS